MENIRVRKLRKLITESFNGSQSVLSALTGVSLSQLGQYLCGYRNMGEKTARKIERGANKPLGWLDAEDEEQPQPSLDENLKKSGFTRIQVYPIGVVNWRDIEAYLSGDVSVVTRTPSRKDQSQNTKEFFHLCSFCSDDSSTDTGKPTYVETCSKVPTLTDFALNPSPIRSFI